MRSSATRFNETIFFFVRRAFRLFASLFVFVVVELNHKCVYIHQIFYFPNKNVTKWEEKQEKKT